jgi:cyclophilin family peptidyl-prolyl cis-trans isomerase
MCVVSSILLSSCTKVIVDFTMEINNNEAPAKYKFENKTSQAERFEWNFGDGLTSNEVSPQHVFIRSGKYEVTLNAFNKSKKKSIKKQILISPPERCLIELKTTEGNMILELSDATPKHREHYLMLADKGIVDSTLFHRVIGGFMIQGGDLGTKPNLTNDQRRENISINKTKLYPEIVDTLIHVKGSLAAARMPDEINPQKLSSPTQFYIVQGSSLNEAMVKKSRGNATPSSIIEKYLDKGGSPQLDGEYTVFGKVIQGIEVLDIISNTPTDNDNRPIKEVRIKSIKVIN